MIEIDGVKKSYSHFDLECSLSINPGTITGILGPNGAGKTTLFKSLVNLINLDQGIIKVFDQDVCNLDKNKVGIVLANTTLCEFLNIIDVMKMLDSIYDCFDKNHFIQQCQDFKLPMDKKISDFSTGMKAKLNMLIALNHGAQLLILDEPTLGLDVIAREEILDLIRQFMEEDEQRCTIISSHISSDLENLCDDIYMMNEGHIILHDTMSDLLDEYGLLKVTSKQYQDLDLQYILKTKQESYGYSCLTKHKQFYQENYPDIVIEKNTLDTLFTMMIGGY